MLLSLTYYLWAKIILKSKINSEFRKHDIKDYIDNVSQNEWESLSDLFENIN
jgi:hypothetical protein